MKTIILTIVCFGVLFSAFADNEQCNKAGNNKGKHGQPTALGDTIPDKALQGEAVTAVRGSVDPNEIIGLQGYDSLRWVSAKKALSYKVLFENDPEFATANAQMVEIRHRLHEKNDSYSVRLGNFGFRNFVFEVPENCTAYSERLDLTDSLGIYVDLVAGLDILKQEAFWIFQSIDPETGLAPKEVDKGLLAINDSLHSGEGFVTFKVTPLSTVLTGDSITASASIVFDDNDTIQTNVWKNTIDAFAPSTTVIQLETEQSSREVLLTWTGNDDEKGTGIKGYEVWVSENAKPFQAIAVELDSTSFSYQLEPNVNYKFSVLGVDNVGNREEFCESNTTATRYGKRLIDLFPVPATICKDEVLSLNWKSEGIDSLVVQYIGEGGQEPLDIVVLAASAESYDIDFSTLPLAIGGSMIGLQEKGGSYSVSTEPFALCDVYTTVLEENICQGQHFTFGEQVLTESGEYNQIASSVAGCDSIVNLLLHVNPNYNDTIFETIQSGQQYAFGEQNLTVAGEYETSFTSTSGCDSTVVLFLQVEDAYRQEVNASICDGEEFLLAGKTYSLPGIYVDTLTAINGSDSIVSLHLSVMPVYELQQNETICSNESYQFGDIILSESGVYTKTFQSEYACDSTVTLHLEVNPLHTESLSASICSGESYAFDGVEYSEPGDYVAHLANEFGCDSTVTLHLEVNPLHTEHLSASICSGESYAFHGVEYSEAGDYVAHLANEFGCDSTVTLHLEVNPLHSESLSASICSGESYAFHGVEYSEAGDYVAHLENEFGCDSTVTLHLEVNVVSETILQETILEGERYRFHNRVLSESGTYTETLISSAGCDSVVVLHLMVEPIARNTISAAICSNESYDFNGQELTLAGTYYDTIQTTTGSKQVDILELAVHPLFRKELQASICQGERYFFGQNELTQGGLYRDTLQSEFYCDSIVTLALNVVNERSPINILISEENNEMNLSWEGESDRYEIYKDGVLIDSVDVARYVDTDVVIGRTYCYTIKGESLGCSTDMSEQSCIVCVGKSDLETIKLQVYPNPTSDKVFVKGIQPGESLEVSIYTVGGKLLHTKECTEKHNVIDLSSQKDGMYLLHFTNLNHSFKILKE